MLWIAGGLAILAGMPQLGLAIFVVILLNGLFAFLQEYRAEKAGERLRGLLPRRVIVVRDGVRRSIDALELVPGDAVVLSAGDGVSADMCLSHADGLSVDTSMLTGESVLTTPQSGEIVFAGTFVVEGEAIGVVSATGDSTRLAQIAQLTASRPRPQSPLAIELNRVVWFVSVICLVVGFVFLIVAVVVGIRLTDAFLFALGVTVALVPEGLLPTVSLSLAIGAQRMAARGALVRRLESVETLGSTTFICTDKTGTLTRNEMSVTEAWTPKGGASIEGTGYDPSGVVHAEPKLLPLLKEMARAAALHGNGRAVLREGRWVAQGNPLDVALDVFARRLNLDVRADRCRRATTRATSARLLVWHEHEADSTVQRDLQPAQCQGRIQHRRQAALHICGTASEERLALQHRGTLAGHCDGHHVVVARRIERPVSSSDAAQHDGGARIVSHIPRWAVLTTSHGMSSARSRDSMTFTRGMNVPGPDLFGMS